MAVTGTKAHFKHIGVGSPVSQDISSKTCMNLAASWVKKCQEQHPHCKQSPTAIPPSRVIDVGDSQQDPRLVETGGKHGRWATLSHCWGKVRPLMTTQSTLDQRKRSIPITYLPKTFQDAIMITRGLGLQYLWIDSLCIVQDSDRD
jgi:hypothetical protein